MTGSAGAAQQPAGLLHLGTFVASERGEAQPHCLGHLGEGVDLGDEIGLHVVGDTDGAGCLKIRSQAGHMLFDGGQV